MSQESRDVYHGVRDYIAAAARELAERELEAASHAVAFNTAAAEGERLILHCEDLDCFDEASLDLLAGVLPRLAGRQVLLVGTGRGRVRLPGARLATIALAPLDDADAAYMKGHLPAPVRLLYPLLIDRPWQKYAATLRAGT